MQSRKCVILASKCPKNYRKMRVYAIHMGGCECQLTHREEWDVIVSSWWSLFGGGGSESESESAPPPRHQKMVGLYTALAGKCFLLLV